MAYMNNPYGAYKQASVKTASQGKLIVMLYEGAISHLEKAIKLIDENGKIKASSIEEYGNQIQKVLDIINELQMSLNMDEGGEIAKNLLALYIFFNKQLMEATVSHDKKILTSVHDMLKELHESWVQASNSTANTQSTMQGSSSSFNISG